MNSPALNPEKSACSLRAVYTTFNYWQVPCPLRITTGISNDCSQLVAKAKLQNHGFPLLLFVVCGTDKEEMPSCFPEGK